MKVFLVGASGGVARRAAVLLIGRGDTVTGMHRRPEQSRTVADTGAVPVLGDLVADTVEELAAKMDGHDAVVFSAGAHGAGAEQTTLIDGKGVEKAAEAASQVGATQFVLVSAFPDSERAAGLGEGFEHYIRVKKGAEIFLTRTDLDWLVVRPGNLRDEPGDGLVTAGLVLYESPVRRDNVAQFIVEALHSADLTRTIVEITDGQTPVAEAVAQVARSLGPRD